MADGLTTALLRESLRRLADNMESYVEELNAVDGALGDGDLGVTTARGLRSVKEALTSLPEDVGMALMNSAQAFVKISGSTFGTLVAIGMMSAAKATRGRQEVPWQEAPALLAGAIAAMSQRGKANLGDKTMLDSLEAVRLAWQEVNEPSALLPAASAALVGALEEFRDRPCLQGRARIFGEKSIGQDDPGMLAIKRIVDALRPSP
ncbi:MAG: dihydroxyacetone kinase subunit L [Armatimonadota bacterium]